MQSINAADEDKVDKSSDNGTNLLNPSASTKSSKSAKKGSGNTKKGVKATKGSGYLTSAVKKAFN